MKTVIYSIVIASSLMAQSLTLSKEQIENWNLHVSTPQKVQGQFLDEIVGEVEAPTKLIHAISIPYDVKVQRVLVNQFENVRKGDPMARIGGNAWLEMQQNMINHSIALNEATLENERKMLLCNEGIIPTKECIRSNASYESALAQFQSAKSMLFLFGVDEKFINTIEKSKAMQRDFEVRAPVSGVISKMDIQVGQSVNASQPLFTLLAKGDLWLSAHIAQSKAELLVLGQNVSLEYHNKRITSQVVSLAPLVDTQTQTVPVRFLIREADALNIGLKATFILRTDSPSVKIPKVWTVMQGKEQIIFIKGAKGFETKSLKVSSEDASSYYSSDLSLLDDKVVTSGVAALKGMLGEDDD
ncbi:MAG: efflux RND transporter periplasmic adaptor subunit [Campylobacterota bacterium]|nr:efflux RND transporter periplasmic adaptor subunit [Campylobacterota bacterium]